MDKAEKNDGQEWQLFLLLIVAYAVLTVGWTIFDVRGSEPDVRMMNDEFTADAVLEKMRGELDENDYRSALQFLEDTDHTANK